MSAKKPTSHAEKPAPPQEDRLVEAIAALVVVALVTLGSSGIFFRLTLAYTLGPFAGIAAALACRRVVDAAFAAAAGVLVGVGLVAALTRLPLDLLFPRGVLSPALLAAAAAAVVAGAAAWARSTGDRVVQLLAPAGVLVAVGSGWYVSVSSMSIADASGMTNARGLLEAPKIDANVLDETLYQDYVLRMVQGDPYYVAAGTTLSEANQARPGTGHDINLASAVSYRLPTMYWVLSKLPANGISWVIATLAIGTIASVSAYWLARACVPAAFALVGTTTVAAMYSGLSEGVQLLHTEVWAGAFALLSVALFVWARKREDVPALLWASAAAALLAAVTRELALAYVVLGLGATLAVPAGRKPLAWAPWAGALAVFAGVYWLHARQVAAVYPTVAAGVSTGRAHWFDPSMIGALASANRIGELMFLVVVPVFAFALLGLVGSVVAPKELAIRIYLGGAVVGGTLVISAFHPSGDLILGLPAAYWSQLVMPAVIASAPLAAALVPAWRERTTPAAGA